MTGTQTAPAAQSSHIENSESAVRATVNTVHTETVAAPARTVYELVADVTQWPYTFGPTVDVEVLAGTDAEERLRLWAFANGAVRTWTSRRSLDPETMHVAFRQEQPASPVLSMGGEWRIEPLGENLTRVALLHDYAAATEDDEHLIARAVDTNSLAELAALRRAAELGADRDSLVLSFDDAVDVAGRQEDVCDFLRDAGAWPERLPHVARLDLWEDGSGVQVMEMDTKTVDGSVHTTHSVRVCRGDGDIVYKQTVTPKIMSAHVGRWTVRPEGPGTVRATSRHTVVLRPEKVTELLGPDATVARAREVVRNALGTNSLTTLRAAKEFAEACRTSDERA